MSAAIVVLGVLVLVWLRRHRVERERRAAARHWHEAHCASATSPCHVVVRRRPYDWQHDVHDLESR